MAVATGTTVLEWVVEPAADQSSSPHEGDAETDLYFEIVGQFVDELQVELIITI